MAGALFQLVTYEPQYSHWRRRFEHGEVVSWDKYLRYIEECLFQDMYSKVFGYHHSCDVYQFSKDLWISDNWQTRLLLRKKFYMETGWNWRQFDDMVFKHLGFRQKPTVYGGFFDIPEAGLREFFVKHHTLIDRYELKRCLTQEPVTSNVSRLQDNILRFYSGLEHRKIELIGHSDERTESVPQSYEASEKKKFAKKRIHQKHKHEQKLEKLRQKQLMPKSRGEPRERRERQKKND